MDQFEAHRRAQETFAQVLARVGPAQLDRPTPCEGWAVRDVVEHLVAGNELVAVRLGAVAEPPARPDGLTDAYAATAADAQRAFEEPGALTKIVQLGTREVPAVTFLGMRTTDAYVHAWDVAHATGQDVTALDPELGASLLGFSRARVTDAMRGPGRPFGAAQPCAEDRPVADQLAAFLGRPVG